MMFLIKKNVKRWMAMARSVSLSRPEKHGVRILMYHSIGGSPEDHRLATRVPTENFGLQLDELLRQRYVTLTVSELIDGGLTPGPAKAIAITFDDGYKDNITEAASMLKARGIKATFFVTTSNID